MSHTEDKAKSRRARSSSVPRVFTSFVGRKQEFLEISRLLASARLVTLIGAAGCGKTRLAHHVVTGLGPRLKDGVYWIDLARLADSELVLQAVAREFQVTDQTGRPLLDGVLNAMEDQDLLLILDNCEHVLDACAKLADTLLANTDAHIMTTSRESLGIAGERHYPVAPLSVPAPDCSMEDVGDFDAVRLFVERALAIVPEFELTPANAKSVVQICRNLAGIPLAIELASARVNVLTVHQIAERLDEDHDVLPASTPAIASHHRTLRAAIDWSYDFLSATEQAFLRRLSVFVGTFSLEAAESICTGAGVAQSSVLDLLTALVGKSMVTADTLQHEEARYSLLEPIRQFARGKLVAHGEATACHDLHLSHYLKLAEETTPKLSSPYQQLWLNWLESKYDNIRAAFSWALESDQIEAGLRIAIALYEFWTIRDYVAEGLGWFERLLSRGGVQIDPLVRANALAYTAFLSGFQGNVEAQMRYGREAAQIAEMAGDDGRSILFYALAGQGYSARAKGDFEAEYEIAGKIIRVSRELNDLYRLGLVLSVYSPTAMTLGHYDVAREMLDESLILLREVGDTYRIAMALNYAGDLARCEQQYSQARDPYEESISLLRDLEGTRDLASVAQNLGHAYLHLGDVAAAHRLFLESIELHEAQQNRPGMAESLIGFAALALACEAPAAGARLLAAAAAHSDQSTAHLWAATRLEYEGAMALACARLPEAEFRAESGRGRSISLDQAVEYAKNAGRQVVQSGHSRQVLDTLTAREHEIAALIAQGNTNEEIAAELVISKRTVEKHVANIRSKLGFSERTQIVRWVIESRINE